MNARFDRSEHAHLVEAQVSELLPSGARMRPDFERPPAAAQNLYGLGAVSGPYSKTGWRRFACVVREEFAGLHLRWLIVRALLALLPIHVGGRIRALGLRLAGFQVGRGTIFAGLPAVTGDRNFHEMLHIGRDCWLNIGCLLDLGAPISIGNKVSLGHGVLVLTRSHELGTASQRAGGIFARPVTVGDGAWLGARCTILPGVKVGAGAVVAAGALVTHDVPENVVVAGVPARIIRKLP